MEGDAGASRLNPPPMSMISRLRRRRPKIRQESDDATDPTSPEVTAEDSSESEVGADPTSPATIEIGSSVSSQDRTRNTSGRSTTRGASSRGTRS